MKNRIFNKKMLYLLMFLLVISISSAALNKDSIVNALNANGKYFIVESAIVIAPLLIVIWYILNLNKALKIVSMIKAQYESDFSRLGGTFDIVVPGRGGENDFIWGDVRDVKNLPSILVERLQHYFVTYKMVPGRPPKAHIEKVYGRSHALKVVRAAITDYDDKFEH